MSSNPDQDLPPVGIDGLRHWQVAGGVVLLDDEVLLVKNLRKGGRFDWTTPGGVVDPGETPVAALTREVEEETGLHVARWTGPLYRVEVVAPDAGFHLRVEAHLAGEVSGEVIVGADPDGIVVEASFVALGQANTYLARSQPWVAEPLLAHLRDGVADGRTFRYHVTGGGRDRRVERR